MQGDPSIEERLLLTAGRVKSLPGGVELKLEECGDEGDGLVVAGEAP